MSLIGIILVLAVLGLILWAVGQFPIDPTIMKLIRVVVIVVAVIWLISVIFPGVLGNLGTVRVH